MYGVVSMTIYRRLAGVMYTPIAAAETAYEGKVIRMM